MTSFLDNHFFDANVSDSGHTWTNNVDSSFLIPQNTSLPEFGIGTAVQYSTNITTTTVWYPTSLLYPFDEFPIGTEMRGDSDWLSDFNSLLNDSLLWDNLQDPARSNGSTWDSKPDSKPDHSVSFETEASEAAPASVFTFTTQALSDFVYLAFVPVLKPKPFRFRSTGLAKASYISPGVVSPRSNGSVNSTSTVRFRHRIDFGRSKITPTLVLSVLARRNGTNLSQFSKRPASTKSSAFHDLASSSQYSVQPAPPTLVLRSSSTIPSPSLSPTVVSISNRPHATPTSACKPTKDNAGSSGSTSKSKHSPQTGTSKSSTRQQAAGEVVNKLTQYVEVSEGPLYMFPKYGGAIVSKKEKKLKPTGTLRAGTEHGPGPSPTNAQTASQPRHYSTSQIIKPSETSLGSTTVESNSSTPQPSTPSKRGTQPGQSKSSGSSGSSRPHLQLPFTPRPPPGYHYVAYRELFAYYYVLYEDGQGRQLETMISKTAHRKRKNNADYPTDH